MNTSNNDSINKDLNAFLSTEEGAREAAKILPLMIPAVIGQFEENISEIAQQSLILTDAIKANNETSNSNSQAIQELSQSLQSIQAALGIAGIKTNNSEAMGQVQPKQPAQQPSDLNDMAALLDTFKSAGKNQNNQ